MPLAGTVVLLRPAGPPLGAVGTVAALALAAFLGGHGSVAAQEADPAAGPVFEIPPLPVETFTLGNGLEVIVSEDHSSPIVAVSMWYRVGSAYEEEGRTGFAHLFEHLLFQETEHLEVGAMDRLVTRAGGLYNATTGPDRTAYFEVLPSNRVNLALWLHAERMARLRLTQDALDTQRKVVQEERRLRIDNQPYGSALIAIETLPQDYEPYRHPTIGSMADLDAAGIDDARAFYERYYVPSNAILAIVGDVELDEVRAMVERYLGGIDRGDPVTALPSPTDPPRSNGERRIVLDDPLARLPFLWVAYTLPSASHPDRPALELLSQALVGGESSRLKDRLIDTEAMALDVVSVMDLRVGPGAIRLGAIPNEGVSVERLEGVLDEEIARVRDEGVTPRELTKAVNARRAELVQQRLTVQSKAEALQWHALHEGSARRLNDEMARYETVTVDDLRRVAETYLIPENRTVVIARPTASLRVAP